jgi:hypothetical protein
VFISSKYTPPKKVWSPAVGKALDVEHKSWKIETGNEPQW